MQKPLRLVLIAALLLFVPLFAARGEAADVASALKYVPNDAVAVGAVDVDKMRRSPLFKFVQDAVKRERELKEPIDELKKSAGFDVMKHLHAAVLIVPPEVLQDDDNFAVVLEITGNEKKLVDAINKKTTITKKDGAHGPVYVSQNGQGAFAFRGKHLIVGQVAIVDKVLAAGAAAGAKPFADLRAQVEKHDAWMVGRTTPELKKELGRESPAAQKLSRYAIGASFSPGVQLLATGHFDDARAAAEAHKQLNEALAHAKGDALVKRLGFGDILNRVSVSQNLAEVKVTGDITASELQKIGKTLEAMQ